MREKHLFAINTLLQLGMNPANSLGSSWETILECISRIEYYMNLSISVKKGASEKSDHLESHDIMVGELLQATIETNMLEHVFTKSSLFNDDEITSFISCLCVISE